MPSNQKIRDICVNSSQTSLEILGFMAEKSEAVQRTGKVTFRMIDLFNNHVSLSAGILELNSRLKTCVEMIEFFETFSRFHELFSIDKKGQSFFQANSWQKIADRVLLTIHSVFKSMGFLSRVGLLALGRLATYTVANIPLLRVIVDGAYVGSSVFSLWDNTNKIIGYRGEIKKANYKIDKWIHRPVVLDKLRAGDPVEVAKMQKKYADHSNTITTALKGYEADLNKAKEHIRTLEICDKDSPVLPEELTERMRKEKKSIEDLLVDYKDKEQNIAGTIAKAEAELNKYEERLSLIQSKDYNGLADELDKMSQAYKLKKWEVIKSNQGVGITKSCWGIANKVGKIAVISFAACMTIFSLSTMPFLDGVLILGVVAESTGLVKMLLDHFYKPQEIPTKPMAAQAA